MGTMRRVKWEIRYEKPAQKYLDTLEEKERERIRDEVGKLEDGPYNRRDLDIKPLQGRDNWRLRVGKWRVIFKIHNKEILISVIKIGSRGDVYK